MCSTVLSVTADLYVADPVTWCHSALHCSPSFESQGVDHSIITLFEHTMLLNAGDS